MFQFTFCLLPVSSFTVKISSPSVQEIQDNSDGAETSESPEYPAHEDVYLRTPIFSTFVSYGTLLSRSAESPECAVPEDLISP